MPQTSSAAKATAEALSKLTQQALSLSSKSNPRTAAAAKASKVESAEAAYRNAMKAGKVTPANIAKTKEAIAKKTGVWPNGATN